MGIVKTNRWIELYVDHYEEQSVQARYRQLFIQPLQSLFAYSTDQQLATYLQKIGLFLPKTRKSRLRRFLHSNCWTVAGEQFNALKQKWQGPNVPVFLLPANEEHKRLQAELGGKMGLGFPDGIVLFISGDIEEKDLKALVTHEYHHVCRLWRTQETESSITLLESMVMEGLAELAVIEEVGEAYVAPWTKKYDRHWQEEWFVRYLEPNLLRKGRSHYKPFLYGDDRAGIPAMLGYYYGFKLCKAAAERSSKDTLAFLDEDAESVLRIGRET
ncbi:DUF2268 domain-containing protein [Shouchella clausii]|uniref:DUF2268 domain-containing protein n=1 Tax=Shouchella clausii TaxID=79880 RepID=A0A268RX11_SHOCL|nr:DUF2268 domain-containing protein [Shouchella clausii]PAD43111.1 hypothetical protein CHH54_08845 [Bacillus sp. 7520-S]MBU8594729.1 DUF2268 domain-containing protein [Shouchella clausii]MCR1287975.1 DUF2268 domain-containing protein [Shouchella clausii]MCY1104842.1 DUF2268 domain-containing protein [Shouchella clausii]MEB5482083.1 DUF2268 domain-containing protein [Shouchella clausii]